MAPATNRDALEACAAVPPSIKTLEIRLDMFTEEPDLSGIREAFRGRLLATQRSRAEGGRFEGRGREAERSLERALNSGFDLVDVELGIEGGSRLFGFDPAQVVVSAHDVEGIPADLDALLEAMQRTGARFSKIVGTARSSTDALKLLAFQREHADGRLSTFAMGEAGLATRVLSPYLGAPLAFGALVPGQRTAPGQIPARDLDEVYGIGRARNVERLFALFGGFVSHSLSPALHNANFEAAHETSLYVPFALESLLTEFDPLVVAFDALGIPLKGASVTIPFKEEAATVAVFRGESVANTLVRSGEAYMAANTDRAAIAAFTPLGAPQSRALVLGAGGTARTAVEVLISRRYDVHVWNRDPVRAHEL
ncbi:MAG: type I 3-dehydroquinate dehydratase, partial [Thermoanaerobaculia bacterium]